MHLKIISIGQKMPSWIEQGYAHYHRKLPRDWQLELLELSATKRNKNANTQKCLEEEGERMFSAIPKSSYVIALDATGLSISSNQMADKLKQWHLNGQDIVFLIGGADGLAVNCLKRANFTLSLSELIFPHALVRVILVEQLYRAWSIINKHPYHLSHE